MSFSITLLTLLNKPTFYWFIYKMLQVPQVYIYRKMPQVPQVRLLYDLPNILSAGGTSGWERN